MNKTAVGIATLPGFPEMAPLPVEYLADYLAHIAIGRMQSEIARLRGVSRSAICQRIVKIENLRDRPVWDAVLTALQEAIFAPLRPLLLDRLTIGAAARNLAGGDPAGLILDYGTALLAQNARIATAEGMDRAVIVSGAEVQADSMPRSLVLAGLLLGWFKPGPEKGRISFLVPSRGFLAALRLIGAHRRPLPLDGILADESGLIGKDEVAQAHDFARIFAAGGDDLDRLRGDLPGQMFEALALVCGKGKTLAQLESALNLPARSGRVFLAAALSFLTHRAQAVAMAA